MRKILLCISLSLCLYSCSAQPLETVNINEADVENIVKILSADDMRGRNSLVSADINKAANFIAYEFEKAGLKYFDKLNYYIQNFNYSKGSKVYPLFNVLGILPGKSLKDEYVVFSAHYDHIGILKTVDRDSIANGADDNASGVTAIIELAKYFAKKNDNERTLIFVAFTAEELGGYGSQYFSKKINPDKVKAMFNIEMIGKESKFGKNNAFITGYERSDFGKILQQNLKNTGFKFYPDPYPEQNLFYRSDNATLARLGVPAHTISSDQIDKDPYYHTVNDEFKTLDIKNITQIIKAIALSSRSIISGEDTPDRVSGVK